MTTLVLIMDMAVSLLLITLAVPLLRNRVPPNDLYGVRIRQSLASPENWYRINRFGAKQLIAWSSANLVMAAVGFLVPFAEGSLLFWFYVLLPAVAAIMACLFTLRFARRV